MALDSVGNQYSNATSLYQPVPVNKLQQNLSQYYEKTSSFVREHFDKLMETENGSMKPQKKLFSSDESGESQVRLNPQGLGQYVDILV